MNSSYKELQPMLEIFLSVKLSEKFYGSSPPLPYLKPFQSLLLLHFNGKSVDKEF